MERLRTEIERTSYARGPRLASSLRKLWVKLRNPNARIEFGPGTHVGPGFSIYAPFGGTFVTGPRAEFRRNFHAELTGRDSRIAFGSDCHCTYDVVIQCGTTITIGDRCVFGQAAIVVDGNHRYRGLDRPMLEQGYDFRPIEIADDALILAKGTVIASIGERGVVGANSVVTKPVPPYTVVGGTPARPIDYFGPEGSEPEGLSAKSSAISG